MQTGSGTKNPPWARSSVNTNMTGMNPQIMDPNSMITQQGMMPFQQTQAVFNPSIMQAQGGMAMPLTGQMPMNQMTQGQMYPGNVVAYPTPRAMNSGLYQNSPTTQAAGEQRVFTGTVTKTHNDFGFVDHDVFYQTSVCTKGIIPKVNDRVLVEASYNPNMPFKWNATRVQVLPTGNPKQNIPKSNSYNAVPPPSNKKSSLPPRRDELPPRRDDRPARRDDRKRSRTRSRSRSRGVREIRSRRDSPPRKRPAAHQSSPVKYIVRVPRIPLDIQKIDVPSLCQRYTNLYIPSDFFTAHVKWGETFPPQSPFALNNPCAYHIMHKDLENTMPNDAVLEPPDADYRFSAKVMLISMPTLEFLYQKCGLTKSEEKETTKRSANKAPTHPTRLIKFLVGQKGKGGENFTIGGPWSPSLDGENPQSDPRVLVKTAIRTCKALTGIDLSSCTQWYRVVEFYYWREGSGGKSRLESVVLFLPDVWSAQPSRIEWTTIQDQYKAACDHGIKKIDDPTMESSSQQQPAPVEHSQAEPTVEKSQIDNTDPNVSTITIDENDDDEDRPEPTHYSKLDLKTIKVDQLRQELRARNVSCKGLRAQLVSRLSKLVKNEEEKDAKGDDIMELEDDEAESAKPDVEELIEISDKDQKSEIKDEQKTDTMEVKKDDTTEKNENDVEKKDDTIEKKDDRPDKPEEKKKTEKEIEEEKKKIEKDKQILKIRYELPVTPHIIVHPSATAKGGKFGCNVATLSLLLDYRVTDNKEHSFELFVFAELFNEMLMRDFGFYIYKTLYTLPEKAEEVKEISDKSSDKADKKDDKKTDGDKKDEKKDDRKDDRRESRRRDRRDSHSDDDRSSSPRRRSRGVDFPPDPYLLLSLVYFDTSRGGYIAKKDLQSLFMSLGLALSRSQIRVILEKVCIKDTFSYRTLVQSIKELSSGSSDAIQDLPLDSTTISPNEVPEHIAELEAAIAAGNRDLLPIFNRPDETEVTSGETKDISDTGIVMYKSRVVDVGALMAAEARGSLQRARLESALDSARAALKAARDAAASTQRAERGAQSQLSDLSAHLSAARARIVSLTASSKIFHSALKSIQSKVEAVVNIKYEDDDVVEVINGPSRQKDTKKEKSEDTFEIKASQETSKGSESTESPKETIAETKSERKEDKDKEADFDNASVDCMEIDDKE